MRAWPPAPCFSTVDLPSIRARAGVRASLSLSLSAQKVSNLVKAGTIFTHYPNVQKKKKKSLIPLFSCLAKCAFHNLLTQPALKKKRTLREEPVCTYIHSLVCYLGSEVLKSAPAVYFYIMFVFSSKKNLMKLYCIVFMCSNISIIYFWFLGCSCYLRTVSFCKVGEGVSRYFS